MIKVKFNFDIDDQVIIIPHNLGGIVMRQCREKECLVYDVEYLNILGKIEEIRCFESDLKKIKAV